MLYSNPSIDTLAVVISVGHICETFCDGDLLCPIDLIGNDAAGYSNRRAADVSQNSRNLSTRFSGGLPAISAELIAPIEMPATQSGCPGAVVRWSS
jgi:hypothetical protein